MYDAMTDRHHGVTVQMRLREIHQEAHAAFVIERPVAPIALADCTAAGILRNEMRHATVQVFYFAP